MSIQDLSLLLDSNVLQQGSNVTGRLLFVLPQDRRISQFTATLTLMGSLHTSVPSKSGIQSHTDRKIYAKQYCLPLMGHSGRIETAFSHGIAADCPITASYGAMAAIKYRLVLTINDLSNPFGLAQTAVQEVTIEPSRTVQKPIARVTSQKKVLVTASPVLETNASYFIQLQHPASFTFTSYKATLNALVQVGQASHKFSKSTERPLRDPIVISRQNPDGSCITVLELQPPKVVESSVNIAGFLRKYSITLYMSLADRSPISFNIDTVVHNISLRTGQSSSSNLEKQESAAVALTATPSNSPSQPIARKSKSASSNLTQLRLLSLDEFATAALAPEQNASKAIVSRSNSQGSSSSSSSSVYSANSSSLVSDSGSETCSSPASSITTSRVRKSNVSQMSQPSISQRGTPSTPSKTTEYGQMDSAEGSSPTGGASKRRHSALQSLYKWGDRLRSKKEMEFSCCGSPSQAASSPSSAPGGPQKSTSRKSTSFLQISTDRVSPISDTTSTMNSPKSPSNLWSVPSSPTRNVARKLSFRKSRRSTSMIGHQVLYPSAHADHRFSISSEYLSQFNFEGLSSLDSEPLELGALLSADDEVSGGSTGVAL